VNINDLDFPTADLLNHREHNQQRQEIIGGTVVHAITEEYVRSFGDLTPSSGYDPQTFNDFMDPVPQSTLRATTLPVDMAYSGPGTIEGASNWSMGSSMLQHSRNTWRGSGTDEVVYPLDMAQTPTMQPPYVATGEMPIATEGQTTRSTPSPTLDNAMADLSMGPRPNTFAGGEDLRYESGRHAPSGGGSHHRHQRHAPAAATTTTASGSQDQGQSNSRGSRTHSSSKKPQVGGLAGWIAGSQYRKKSSGK
jgi:hypothetical protein